MAIEPAVFVVDDDLSVLKSMRWLIESADLPVRTFSSAALFLAALEASWSGCLVLDMRMPGMNGLEVQNRLSEMGCELPVIVMTGHGDVPACAKSFKAGAFDFIEKPANDDYLLNRIKQALAADRQRRRFSAKSPEVQTRLAKLTPREAEVMDLIVGGKTLKQIAAALDIGMQTAAKHRTRVLAKLRLENDVELARLACNAPPAG